MSGDAVREESGDANQDNPGSEGAGFTEIRTDLVRAGMAHERRSQVAVDALPGRDQEAPEWLMDAWRGSTMAALYARTLAAVLRDVEGRLSEEDRGDLASMVAHWLENGVEDENLDVWPAEVTL